MAAKMLKEIDMDLDLGWEFRLLLCLHGVD